MAETTGSADSPASPADPPAKETTQPAADTTVSAVEASLPSVDSSAPAMDLSQPPLSTSFAAVNAPAASIESSLPEIDKSIPSLDTTLSVTDTATSVFETAPSGPQFPDSSGTESPGVENTASAPAAASDNVSITDNPTGGSQPSSSAFASPSNGTDQYMPHPTQHPQQQQQQQQQQQKQQQDQHQIQQHPGMYTNSQAPPVTTSAPTTEAMDNHAVQAQHTQPAQVPQAPIGSPLPSSMPSMSSMDQYMQSYPTNPIGLASSPQMQYHQLAGDPINMLSGSKHKKEVKRRTKTGCLTCRKRRIKCDEGHPVCRNCVKSKRECLGYDPVFRAQPSTPSAIQPAPNPPPSLVVNPQDPSAYPGAPPGYVPASSQPFAPSWHSESPAPSTDQFDQGTTVDPSLQSNPASDMTSLQTAVDDGLQSQVNATTADTAPASESSAFKVKQVRITDLIALRGIPPPPPHPIVPIQPSRLDEIQAVYLATYAPAIDKLLETRWFHEKGLPHLLANAQLVADYSALIDAFNDRNLGDPSVMARLESFEVSVVWSTMTLCRHVLNVSNGNNVSDYDLTTASTRLDVIEALITGEHMESDPLSQFSVREPASNPPSFHDQLLQRSLDFWSSISHFLTLHDDEASSAKEIDDTLARTRTLLDMYENRDVIYSIAIARHIGQRWADFPRSFPHPITTNEKDAGAKLYVAQKFLEQEASGKGTTQVVRRICGMVLRSWIVSRE